MKYIVEVTTSNPSHEHISLRRVQKKTNFVVEASNEAEALNRARNKFRSLGHYVHNASIAEMARRPAAPERPVPNPNAVPRTPLPGTDPEKPDIPGHYLELERQKIEAEVEKRRKELEKEAAAKKAAPKNEEAELSEKVSLGSPVSPQLDAKANISKNMGDTAIGRIDRSIENTRETDPAYSDRVSAFKKEYLAKKKAADAGQAELNVKEEAEQVDEVAPPGREKQVKALKKIKAIKNPYAVAWASYNKSKTNEEVEQIDEGDLSIRALYNKWADHYTSDRGHSAKRADAVEKAIIKVHGSAVMKHLQKAVNANLRGDFDGEKNHFERARTAAEKSGSDRVGATVGRGRSKFRKEEVEHTNEALVGDQHKIDANKNGRVDAHDFKLLRAKKKIKEIAEASRTKLINVSNPNRPEESDDAVNARNYVTAGPDAQFNSPEAVKARIQRYGSAQDKRQREIDDAEHRARETEINFPGLAADSAEMRRSMTNSLGRMSDYAQARFKKQLDHQDARADALSDAENQLTIDIIRAFSDPKRMLANLDYLKKKARANPKQAAKPDSPQSKKDDDDIDAFLGRFEHVERIDETASHFLYSGTVNDKEYELTIPRNRDLGDYSDESLHRKLRKENPHLEHHEVTAIVDSGGVEESNVDVEHEGEKYTHRVINHSEPERVYNEQVERINEFKIDKNIVGAARVIDQRITGGRIETAVSKAASELKTMAGGAGAGAPPKPPVSNVGEVPKPGRPNAPEPVDPAAKKVKDMTADEYNKMYQARAAVRRAIQRVAKGDVMGEQVTTTVDVTTTGYETPEQLAALMKKASERKKPDYKTRPNDTTVFDTNTRMAGENQTTATSITDSGLNDVKNKTDSLGDSVRKNVGKAFNATKQTLQDVGGDTLRAVSKGAQSLADKIDPETKGTQAKRDAESLKNAARQKAEERKKVNKIDVQPTMPTPTVPGQMGTSVRGPLK